MALIVLVLWVATTWKLRGETVDSLGFSLGAAVRSFSRWRIALFALLLLVLALYGHSIFQPRPLAHALRYFAWCVVQQAVFQSMVAKPLRSAIKSELVAVASASLLFALVHSPNPVLVPATLIWGACACLMFLTNPSVVALGIMQVLLSAIGVAVFPAALHHGFRIGPAY